MLILQNYVGVEDCVPPLNSYLRHRCLLETRVIETDIFTFFCAKMPDELKSLWAYFMMLYDFRGDFNNVRKVLEASMVPGWITTCKINGGTRFSMTPT